MTKEEFLEKYKQLKGKYKYDLIPLEVSGKITKLIRVFCPSEKYEYIPDVCPISAVYHDQIGIYSYNSYVGVFNIYDYKNAGIALGLNHLTINEIVEAADKDDNTNELRKELLSIMKKELT